MSDHIQTDVDHSTFGIHFDWERSETSWLLADLHHYLDTMEAALEDTRALHRSTLQTSAHEYDDEVEREEAWREHYTRFEEEFPTKLRYSFLILLHSYLEARTSPTLRFVARPQWPLASQTRSGQSAISWKWLRRERAHRQTARGNRDDAQV